MQKRPITSGNQILYQDHLLCFISYVPGGRIFYLWLLIFSRVILCEVYNIGQWSWLQKTKSILGSLSTKVLLSGTNSIIERAEDVDPVLTFQKHIAKRQLSWSAIESRDFAVIQKSSQRAATAAKSRATHLL